MKSKWHLLVTALVLICASCATGRHDLQRKGPATIPSIWPVQNADSRIASPFGLRGQGRAARHHNGVDITARKGEPVLAAADGLVLFSGRAGSYGKAVLISHGNGIETCYAHLRKCIAKKGRSVTQGDRIGKVGRTGRADGYHLHYEMRVYGTPIDPSPYLPRPEQREQAAQE